jgi:hypothetical protein
VAVPDAVLRRKLFQASSQHTPVLQRADLNNPVGTFGSGWAKISCRCGWDGPGIALHEHQMDELVKAVRSAYAADQLALTRLSMLVTDHPDDAVPTVSLETVQAILSGDVGD